MSPLFWPLLPKILKLKDTPPANELYATREQARAADKFPLEVVMCTECKHVQLKHIVNPKDYLVIMCTSQELLVFLKTFRQACRTNC